jgi:predicted RNase H-like HicB family nuclease/predicted RNA binding protein YcfA (HicA-like mRNA interferase family)
MELAIRVQVEELPEGVYVATSDELPGLVAQGRTVAEALDMARDVARQLIEARREREGRLLCRLPRSAAITRRRGRIDGEAFGTLIPEIARKLRACGFMFDRQAAGSHEIWFNPATNRYTTVPNHPGDMPEGTMRAILTQAGIDSVFLNV